MSPIETPGTEPDVPLSLRGELAWAALLHLWNDGLPEALSVLLPSIASELRLTYTQAALLPTASAVAIGAAQIPLAALSAGRLDVPLLGGGLAWFGLSSAGLALATSVVMALAAVAVAGIGGGAYHPLATNRVAQLAPARGVGRAIGTLNFAGDVGKVLVPAAAGAAAALAGWRASLEILGGSAALTGAAYLWSRRTTAVRERRQRGATAEAGTSTGWWGIQRPGPFTIMAAMSVLDNGIRAGTLTFLPFLLTAHGFGKAQVGALFALMLIGGAVGKLGCGWVTDAVGQRTVITATEVLTAAGLASMVWAAGSGVLAAYLIVFGVVLNGTSSVFYAAVAEFIDPRHGSRSYGLFYTGAFAGAALVPVACGALADRRGLGTVFGSLALLTLTIPLLGSLLGDPGRRPGPR